MLHCGTLRCLVRPMRTDNFNTSGVNKKSDMPLVLMCGFPASGKTKRASELKHYLEKSSGRVVHVIGDESLGVNKNTVYEGTTSSLSGGVG